jgi:hypothetical protein
LELAFFEWSALPVSPSTPFPRTLLVLDGRIIPGKRDEIALEVIGDEMADWFIVVDEDDKGVWVNSFGMSFSSLSMVLGGNGVVNPANLVEMSSADVEEGEEMSEDLLLLRLPPVEFPSKIIFNGGG